MSYATIDPSLWDDATFCQFTGGAQSLFLYLHCGADTGGNGFPGLVKMGLAALAEARRVEPDEIAANLDELKVAGWAQVDVKVRLIQLPTSPSFRQAAGAVNIVKHWWNRWCELPDSDLKYAQVPLIRPLCRDWTKLWNATFGRVPAVRPLGSAPTLQLSGLASEPLGVKPSRRHTEAKRKPTDTTPQDDDDDRRLSEGSTGNGSADVSKDVRSLADAPRSRSRSGSRSGSDPGSDPRASEGGAGGSDDGPLDPPMNADERAASLRLWQLQEQLRAELPYECRPLSPTEADLERVTRGLRAIGEDGCTYAQENLAAEAEANPAAAVYFNGKSNWALKKLDFASRAPRVARTGGRAAAGRKWDAGSAIP